MNARSVSRTTEQAAIASANLDQRMRWRIRHYGYPCLTVREHEAMEVEMRLLRYSGQASLQAIAAKMRVTRNGARPVHQNVSKYLASAEYCMRYFEKHGIAAGWERRGDRKSVV